MKINLEQEEHDALAQMVGSGANYVKVLEKIFKVSIDDLKDITHIDPKGNMGLQTLARQEAVNKLIDIRDVIFPGQSENKPKKVESGAVSKWR